MNCVSISTDPDYPPIFCPVTQRPAVSDLPFPEALRELLSHRSSPRLKPSDTPTTASDRATLNGLAARIGVAQSHLWRIVNRPDERRATLELIASVAQALELPSDYFLETRLAVVQGYLRSDPQRLNALYTEATRASTAR